MGLRFRVYGLGFRAFEPPWPMARSGGPGHASDLCGICKASGCGPTSIQLEPETLNPKP